MHPWHDLEPGLKAPDVVNVVVEIPYGSRNKYEVDKASGLFKLDRVLYSAVHFPGDYGFIPRSYYDDHDPFDVLVLTHSPTFTGCIVEARPVGLFRMTDKGLPDDKVLAVLHRDPSFLEVQDLSDLPAHALREIEHFFRVYKDLEGVRVETLGFEPAKVARDRILHALRLYRDEGLGSKRPAS
jgi:inorganic pyrophosphatase